MDAWSTPPWKHEATRTRRQCAWGLYQSEPGRTEVVGVEQWAEIRRLYFVRGLSMREIHRRIGLHRDTISKAIRSDEPPVYRRAPSGSKLDAVVAPLRPPLCHR